MHLRRRHRKRAAGASAVSLLLHGLFLVAMVAGLRAVPPPVEDRPIEVSLMRPAPVAPVVRPIPAPSRTPQRAVSGPVTSPRPVPAAPQAPPAVAVPPAPPPGPAAINPGDIGGPKGLLPSLTARAGCDDPLSFHLNEQQRAACDQKLAETAKAAKPLALDFAKAKLEEYERQERCKKLYKTRGIPSSSARDESTGAQMAGLGYNPSLRECGPKDR